MSLGFRMVSSARFMLHFQKSNIERLTKIVQIRYSCIANTLFLLSLVGLTYSASTTEKAVPDSEKIKTFESYRLLKTAWDGLQGWKALLCSETGIQSLWCRFSFFLLCISVFYVLFTELHCSQKPCHGNQLLLTPHYFSYSAARATKMVFRMRKWSKESRWTVVVHGVLYWKKYYK